MKTTGASIDLHYELKTDLNLNQDNARKRKDQESSANICYGSSLCCLLSSI